ISESALVELRDEEQKLISTSGSSASKLSVFDNTINDKLRGEHDIITQINKLERESDTLKRDLSEIKEKELSLNKILRSFEFDVKVETFDVYPLIQSLEKEHASLANSLNAIAPQRYVEVSTGYRSMSGRKNELEEERNTIVSFIEAIEKDKRQTFLDAFDTVDKEIRSIFTKMNGGNAWLELENEDDIFNSGISYMIQFQNKPKRESTSISGGEKTLAAVVFVLGLQKLKPSPFYLFDEIDAHLDAPNSERLAKIVEERSNGSQFIMVSLKDSVVQKAKLIYGVYPERGVSKVVTYKDKRIPSLSKIAN
ncbi:MAG: AAA family ATPase, partial [Thermoproteota archaeon]|nr:AAA family ATPase [Thermoproteota archaeon]